MKCHLVRQGLVALAAVITVIYVSGFVPVPVPVPIREQHRMY